MAHASLAGLRIVLALAGALVAVTGINVAFGGIQTLGWQGERAFLAATNSRAFLVQDSHVRFLGGLWLGIGALFLAASTNPRRFRSAVQVACVLTFAGGLARLTQMRPDITLGPGILGSWLAEVIGMPLLYLWISRAGGASDRGARESG